MPFHRYGSHVKCSPQALMFKHLVPAVGTVWEFLAMRGLVEGFESVEIGLRGNSRFWFSLSSLLPSCHRDTSKNHKSLLLCSPALMNCILQVISPQKLLPSVAFP